MEFYEIEPTLDNYWRSIILFGRNVASYKFALAKSFYELNSRQNDLISLEDLAEPFSRHLCEHLKSAPKQITSNSSRFLEACNQYNNGTLTQTQLISKTVQLGFNNVIDAFHIVNSGEIPHRFFVDEIKLNKGIRITDNFFKLAESAQFRSFEHETEARWKLVEHGWGLGIANSLISVEYDQELKSLFTSTKERRVDITSCRDSLNGYQKGRCFYCYCLIDVDVGSTNLADVDHFLPWMLSPHVPNVNGVWNLVLACQECNRGTNGKFARVPSLQLLKRLHKRNEYFINSHLPLRETLIRQTGKGEQVRMQFLQSHYNLAKQHLIHTWQPVSKGISSF